MSYHVSASYLDYSVFIDDHQCLHFRVHGVLLRVHAWWFFNGFTDNLQIISKLYRIHTNSNKTAIESYKNILTFFKTMAILFFSSSIFILRRDFQSKTLASESYWYNLHSFSEKSIIPYHFPFRAIVAELSF